MNLQAMALAKASQAMQNESGHRDIVHLFDIDAGQTGRGTVPSHVKSVCTCKALPSHSSALTFA